MSRESSLRERVGNGNLHDSFQKAMKPMNRMWNSWATTGALPVFAPALISLICSTTAVSANLLLDGSGFETGPDGWDVLAERFIQDPSNPTAEYIDVYDVATAPLDTVPEGSYFLSLHGDPWLQRHAVRWPMTALSPDTDYTFSVLVKGNIDAVTHDDCSKLGFYTDLRVTNGDASVLTNGGMRMISGDVTNCWSRLVFQFNTADIPVQARHPDGMYSFKLHFSTTRQQWSNEHDYQLYVDAVQLEEGASATPYSSPRTYDIGVDVQSVSLGDPLDERALRRYKLFEDTEPLNFRYWVHAEEGSPRPGPLGYRVVDAYELNENGRPEILIDMVQIPDPLDGIGTIEIDADDLKDGSGIYKLVVAAPLELITEELIFGILKPETPYMGADPNDVIFGAQLPHFRYLHMDRNHDGYDFNDRPECENAPTGTPACTTKRMIVMGPDPAVTFTLLKRLGIHHLRIKHLFLPAAIAPTTGLNGAWDATQTRWFAELANEHNMTIDAMIGDEIDVVEDLSKSNAAGYPAWMSPVAIGGPEGWEAFFEGNTRHYYELSQELAGLVEGWEVFNEPTSIRNNMPLEHLLHLDSLATSVFHTLDPGSRVVGFGLTGMSPRGLIASEEFPQGRDALFGEFIEAGGLNYMDVASIRFGNTVEMETYADSAYTHGLAMRLVYCGRALHTEVNRLIDAYDPANRGFPFWATETNIMAGSGYKKFNVTNAADIGSVGRRVDPHRDAARLVSQLFVNAAATGVERVFYFSFDNIEFSGIFNAPYRSLVDVYGSPRSAMMVAQNAIRLLSGAELVEQTLTESKSVILFFENLTEDVVVLFRPDPSLPPLPFELDEQAFVFDMFGNRLERPNLGPEPVFIVGRSVDPHEFTRNMERQIGAPRPQDASSPTLKFDAIPSVSPTRWDFECAPHIWLSQDDNLFDRNINLGKRFGDTTEYGVIISGEYSCGYNDDIPGVPTAIHSDFTVMSGLELKTTYRYLKQQVVAPSGYVREYLGIKDRDGTQEGVFLLATNDDNVTSDPRYRVEDFRIAWALPVAEGHLAVPEHTVDLMALLTENGFEVINGTEYLLDIVLYAWDEDAEIGVDNVFYTDTP